MSPPVETKAMLRKRHAKQVGKAAVLGAVLGLLCHLLPAEYHGPCETILKICTGGL